MPDKKRGSKGSKYVAPVVITAVATLFSGGLIAFFIWLATIAPIPWYLVALFIAVYAALIIGIISALVQRIKEIKGGEEDKASKY